MLVVEDHDDTRRVLVRALRRRGFVVLAANSVASACEAFARQPADLLVCDIGLPDGSGWDVLRRLRENSAIKAIAVTGYGMDGDLDKSEAAGFDAHVVKPMEFSHLEAVIRSLLEENGADL